MKQVFETIGDFISRHARMNIMIFLALTVLFALGLPKIQMQMGNEVFISKSSSVYKNTKIYQNHWYRQEFCVREYSQIRFFNLGGGV
ncbi:hypothetical protein [Bacillus smithii]|uniref:hypothetical protein n=1 Tax=Bacillus smithii TaxID=1479 RepID=UPI0030C9ACE2